LLSENIGALLSGVNIATAITFPAVVVLYVHPSPGNYWPPVTCYTDDYLTYLTIMVCF